MTDIITQLSTPKSPVFIRAEQNATRFWQSLGFETPAKTHCLREDPILDDLGLLELPQTIAICDQSNGEVYVREKMIEERGIIGGEAEITGILVHEKAHSIDVNVQNQPESDVRVSAFDNNVFLAEGFAAFHDGWARRSVVNPLSPPVALKEPSCNLPAHYVRFDTSGKPDDRYISGPDGYAVELLGYSAEKKRLMSASSFIAAMLEARRPETRQQAITEVTGVMEQLQSGLPDYFAGLQYSRDDWRAGLEVVQGIAVALHKNFHRP